MTPTASLQHLRIQERFNEVSLRLVVLRNLLRESILDESTSSQYMESMVLEQLIEDLRLQRTFETDDHLIKESLNILSEARADLLISLCAMVEQQQNLPERLKLAEQTLTMWRKHWLRLPSVTEETEAEFITRFMETDDNANTL